MAKSKILIIDDDADLTLSMKIPLEAHGYTVETASSGKEGLAKVLTFEPDLVILDVMMETTTEGFQVSYALRDPSPESPYRAFAATPILMVSAVSKYTGMKYDPAKDGDFLPVTEFIEKPVEPDKLLSKVEKALARA